MAEFDLNNKISYDDLSPSLQAMLKGSISEDQYTEIENKINKLTLQLNGIRLSIVTDVNQIPDPVNNKEMAIVQGPKYVYMATYNNGWKKACAVYA